MGRGGGGAGAGGSLTDGAAAGGGGGLPLAAAGLGNLAAYTHTASTQQVHSKVCQRRARRGSRAVCSRQSQSYREPYAVHHRRCRLLRRRHRRSLGHPFLKICHLDLRGDLQARDRLPRVIRLAHPQRVVSRQHSSALKRSLASRANVAGASHRPEALPPDFIRLSLPARPRCPIHQWRCWGQRL